MARTTTEKTVETTEEKQDKKIKLPTKKEMESMTNDFIKKYKDLKDEEEKVFQEFEDIINSYYDDDEANKLVGAVVKQMSKAAESQTFFIRTNIPLSLAAFLLDSGNYTIEEIPAVENDKSRDLSISKVMLQRWYKAKRIDFSLDCRIFWD